MQFLQEEDVSLGGAYLIAFSICERCRPFVNINSEIGRGITHCFIRRK